MSPLEAPVTKVALFLILAGTLAAQAPRGGGHSEAPRAMPSPRAMPPPRALPPPHQGGGPGRVIAPQDPRFMVRLYQMRVNRIQQVVGLPEDRARVVAEKWSKWDREHMDRGQQAVDLRKQFNQVLLGPGSEEDKNAALKPIVDQFMALRREAEISRKNFEEDIRSGLTPAQQARLILVMEEIQQRLKEGLRDVKGKGE
jgi:hypothetical protein